MPGPDGGKPLVSVVINCYNGERFLAQTIDSVYAQKWPNWEIVFWDNASTDGTAAIARGYDERLRYFRAAVNTPLGEARNLAFAQARGEFIAMIDADDLWFPDTLERLVRGMQDEQAEYAFCCGGVETIDAAGQPVGRIVLEPRRGELFGSFLKQFSVMPCASMVRRSVVVESGHRFEPSLTTSEDYWFFMHLAADYPVQVLEGLIARYRVHAGALTNRTMDRWADEWQYTLDDIRRTHAGIDRKFEDGFRHAEARIDYYRARNFMRLGRRAEARQLLRQNVTTDIRYLVLFLVSLMPSGMWDFVHRWYHKRSAV